MEHTVVLHMQINATKYYDDQWKFWNKERGGSNLLLDRKKTSCLKRRENGSAAPDRE